MDYSRMDTTSPPIVIAEIGCNHMGDFEIAKELVITAATFCKVDVIKFQKRYARELLSPDQYAAPHPNPQHSYGASYGEHRERLELTLDQHRELKAIAEAHHVTYSSSVWDMTSAREIASLKPALIKIPSATNTHTDLLEFLAASYEGEIHVSVGMTTHAEEERLVSLFRRFGRSKDLVLYSCTSGYPVKMEEVCLLEITRLIDSYGSEVKAIGFSGHHLGISVDIAALTLGARYFERHYTLDRTWKGTDHAASLEPDGMRRLARDLRAVQKTLTYKRNEMLPVELEQRDKLKYRGSQA